MGAPSVLISGASIAGPALAYWLDAYGWRTTVVERFGELREEGQNIDVRGAGREVARRMGIEEEIRKASTGERGTEFVRADGARLARFAAGTSDSDGATAELEILRGQLSRILVERTRPRTRYVFGDRIIALDDHGDAVTVTFASGARQVHDVVVLAEGLRSRTRGLVFPDVDPVHELDFYVAYLTIPRVAGDTDLWRWHSAGRGRSVTLRPDNVGTVRATLGFLSDVRGLDELDREAQVTILRRTFADVGWEASRVLAALGRAPLYFDAVGQARLPSWSRGRVALVGDAAYCASPISGMGTSLALAGAYVLAGELAGHPHRTAFARYERVMRPYVEQAQKLPPGAPGIANPRGRVGLAAMNGALRVAGAVSGGPLGGMVSRWFTPPAEAIELPAYPEAEGRPGLPDRF
ncbi:FAD-dependent monooxygenase [Streptomyces sp. NPDC060194]|uniref:FAD-dependent monooxygenase n=1 Tax=Streptomyces sp. NPDC060194 TaxID=3347069 RepID=UPI0036685096